MDFFELVKKRHSYRGEFLDQKIDRSILQKIVEAGIAAPSGKNGQTTTFVIIDDLNIVDQLQKMHPHNDAMRSAKYYIACIIDKEPPAIYEGYNFQIEDCSAAVENMLLAITELGFASVWIDGWLRLENRNEKIGKMIELPSKKIIEVILPVGKAKIEKKQPPKKDFNKRSAFNSYKKIDL